MRRLLKLLKNLILRVLRVPVDCEARVYNAEVTAIQARMAQKYITVQAFLETDPAFLSEMYSLANNAVLRFFLVSMREHFLTILNEAEGPGRDVVYGEFKAMEQMDGNLREYALKYETLVKQNERA